ncbi:MAG: NAD(P)H-dependent glycerol-3-phosphate dehydrogenase [Thermoplasmatota archaeon]
MGAGSWGTSLAILIASRGERVKLWARNPNVVSYMNVERHNPKYITEARFPESLSATASLKEALDGEDLVVHAIPSKATREMAREYAKHLDSGAHIVSATKGLEKGSFKRMSEVIAEETRHRCAAISGPNHAEEVSALQPTAAVIAFPDFEDATALAKRFDTRVFKAYPRRDLVGTEVCGAYKNVVALAGGMAEGLGWGDNSIAALVTLGVDEMLDVVRTLGGDDRTVYGLAGIGDLVATATSKHSRNRFYGRELARGLTAPEIEKKMHGMVAEGYFATRAFYEFAEAEKLDLPLVKTIYHIVYEGMTVHAGVEMLLSLV